MVRGDTATAVDCSATRGFKNRAARIALGLVFDILTLFFIFLERGSSIIIYILSIGSLDQPSRWSVVPRYRETKRRTIAQIKLTLDKTFAERCFTDNQTPVPVLNRSCDNLAGGCRSMIDKNNERPFVEPAVATGHIFFIELRLAAFRIDHLLSFRQQLVRDSVRLIQEPTRIISQIEDELLHALLFEFIQCADELIA